jgi:hypothetical protein
VSGGPTATGEQPPRGADVQLRDEAQWRLSHWLVVSHRFIFFHFLLFKFSFKPNYFKKKLFSLLIQKLIIFRPIWV